MIMHITSEKELRRAHELCLRTDFQEDFIRRCRERFDESIGRCNLPLDSLPEQDGILETAFSYYQHMRDCNVAYNDTLNAVIDQIEGLMANGEPFPTGNEPTMVIIIEEGIVSAAYSSLKQVSLEIVELDKDYASAKLRDSIYETFRKDNGLSPCEYRMIVPGYEDTERQEVKE